MYETVKYISHTYKYMEVNDGKCMYTKSYILYKTIPYMECLGMDFLWGPLDCLFSRFFIGPDSTKETVWVSYDLC